MFSPKEVIIILSILGFINSLRLVEVRIPKYVIKGSVAQLECLYDLDGVALYSVKWYKDGNEFYRYVPRDMPPVQTFLLPGVSVDISNSSDSILILQNVALDSGGRYRCEVSGEAPYFHTVTEQGDMIIVSLPDEGPPRITGGRPRYQINDYVNVNCTAGRSKPAVHLTWFVNGEAVEPHTLIKYPSIKLGHDGLEKATLGLRFRVEQRHFLEGDMKLKCVASLSTFYWRSNEESVEGDRPQKAPVMESRETFFASNSRADPVQASNTDSLKCSKAPSLFILLLLILLANGCFQQLFISKLMLKQNIFRNLDTQEIKFNNNKIKKFQWVRFSKTSLNNCLKRQRKQMKVAATTSMASSFKMLQKVENENSKESGNGKICFIFQFSLMVSSFDLAESESTSLEGTQLPLIPLGNDISKDSSTKATSLSDLAFISPKSFSSLSSLSASLSSGKEFSLYAPLSLSSPVNLLLENTYFLPFNCPALWVLFSHSSSFNDTNCHLYSHLQLYCQQQLCHLYLQHPSSVPNP